MVNRAADTEIVMDELSERRIPRERRRRDVGPPSGCIDRRRLTERRVPCLAENIISDAEWRQLFGVVPSPENTTL